MTGPEQIAPTTVQPLHGQSDVARVASTAAARSAQTFPVAATARALLVRRSMAQHFTSAQDNMDALLEAGHADADLIELEGLREAVRALEGRIGSRIATAMGGDR